MLKKLSILDPQAILAGGAPRDWSYDKPANDLDFYMHMYNHQTHDNTIARLKAVGVDVIPFDVKSKQSVDREGYKNMKKLIRIYEGVYEGQEFQIMCMEPFKHGSDVVREFGCSICEYFMNNFSPTIHSTQRAKVSRELGMCFINEGYKESNKHLDKMKYKFPKLDYVSSGCYEGAELMYLKSGGWVK